MGRRREHIQSLVLERHRSRRAQGVPTLSVLLGDAEIAEWCWSRWQASRSAASTRVTAGGASEMLGEWLSRCSLLDTLREELLKRGAAARGVTSDEFALTLGSFVREGRREGVDQISAWVGYGPELVAIVAGGDTAGLLSFALRSFPRGLVELEQALPAGLPGIFARIPATTSPSAFDGIVSSLLRVTAAVPRMELALSLTPIELAAWRQRADAREKHLVREGLIEVEAAAGAGASPRGPTKGEGARAPARAKGSGDIAPRLEYDAAEFARSRAERRLFDHLEGRPRTRGLFRLNGTIAAPFGGRDLEVDLLGETLRVALEIDGYHHFRDAAAYRRDRDKDVRLQRLGYTVVRVLATDVDGALEYVTDTIDRVVDHARSRRGNREGDQPRTIEGPGAGAALRGRQEAADAD